MGRESVHIGREIEKVLRSSGMTQTEFARRMGMAQSNVRRLLERQSMETEKLEKVCEALDYNFFECYTKGGENLSTLAEGVTNWNTPTVPSDAAAAYLKGKRDGYDEALALMGTASKENKKAV